MINLKISLSNFYIKGIKKKYLGINKMEKTTDEN